MKKIIFSTIIVGIVLFLTNCHKIEPTKTVITALNESKIPMQNVKILIHAESSQSTPANVKIADSAYTNSKGQVEFDFSNIYKDGQAGVAVLDIKGTIKIANIDYEGFSYVQLESGLTNPATVIIAKKVVDSIP